MLWFNWWSPGDHFQGARTIITNAKGWQELWFSLCSVLLSSHGDLPNPLWSSSTPAGNEKEEGRAAVRAIQGDGSTGRGNGTHLCHLQILAVSVLLHLPHLQSCCALCYYWGIWSHFINFNLVNNNIIYDNSRFILKCSVMSWCKIFQDWKSEKIVVFRPRKLIKTCVDIKYCTSWLSISRFSLFIQ